MFSRRNHSRKGSEIIEFTLVFLPLMVILCVIIDLGWAVFAKSTLQRAARLGVRTGVSITGAQASAAGSCLTSMVKTAVQQSALGLLGGAGGLSKIKVHYLQPPDPSSTAAATDVSTQTDGNTPGNIMQVSVEGFSLIPLLPRFFDWRTGADKSPMILTVFSADRIEPSHDPPCIGTAP